MTACRPAQHRPRARPARLHAPAGRARGAPERGRRAADRRGDRRRRRPRLDLPQPGDARDDRDRAPRPPRPRPRPLRARRPQRRLGDLRDAAAARRRSPSDALQAIRLAVREAAGFEPAFTHFPIVGRCATVAPPNLSRGGEAIAAYGTRPGTSVPCCRMARRCRSGEWQSRHRALRWLLWAHVVAMPIISLLFDQGLGAGRAGLRDVDRLRGPRAAASSAAGACSRWS